MKTEIIDANGLIMGRLATIIAKKLLLGEKIDIVNAEKAIISGKKRSIIHSYKKWLEIRTATAPWRGPFHPRKPNLILRRTIRGMLPWDRHRGKMAYGRLKVHIGIPAEFQNKEIITIKNIGTNRLKGNYIELGELARQIGWNPLIKQI